MRETDEALEARWKAGSAPAFALLFERYHERVFGFTLKMTNDRHLAEDLAQRAFMKLYEHPPPGGKRAMFKTLLYTVARNEALNELARRQRRRESTLDGRPEAAAPSSSPLVAADADEGRERVRRALATLAEDDREVLLLREGEGLTIDEVCEVTGLTRDAVRWRLGRGLAALQAALSASSAERTRA